MRKSALTPTSALAKRFADLFHRKHSTPWQLREVRLFRPISKSFNESDFSNVERRYRTLWPPGRNKNSLRHDLHTFLYNYAPEVDRANIWCEQNPLKIERKIIQMPPPQSEAYVASTDPEEIAALARFDAERAQRKKTVFQEVRAIMKS